MGRAAVITPRLLTKQQAATYCGVSVETFGATCPVSAIAVGSSRRLERYDMRDLDTWIEGIKNRTSPDRPERKRSVVDLLAG